MKFVLLLLISVFYTIVSAGQSIKGKVTNSSGVPVEGETVSVVGIKIAVQTDSRGIYSIEASPGERLEFTSVGYRKETQLRGHATGHYLSAIAQCFIGDPGNLYENGFSAEGQNETCATYNMLKLTDNLFLYSQRAELMNYYERALYNHILASVAENNPGNTYHVPL